jgi:DNA polymerase I-like protein with 3'-5' exonuclease and polymerase domains
MLIEKVEDLKKIPKSAPIVYLDVETTGLDPRKDSLLLVQLYINDISYVINFTTVKTIEPLRNLLQESLVVAHNMTFDYQWIYAQGIEMQHVACTMVNESLLTAGLFVQSIDGKGMSLASTVYRRYNIVLNKSIRDEFINYKGTISQDALLYAEQDTIVLKRLYEDQIRELEHKGLLDTYKLECDLLPVTARMEYVGIPFSKEDLESIRPKFVDFAHKSAQLLQDVFIHNGAADTIVCERDYYWCVNPDSKPQMVEVFNNLGIRVDSLNQKTLVRWDYKNRDEESIAYEDYTDDLTFVDALESYGGYTNKILRAYAFYIGAEKLLTSYIDKMIAKAESDRLYLRFNQVGARSTGRYSGDGQQLPKDSKLSRLGINASIRNCVKASEGMVLVGADLAAIELVILADRSGDERLIYEIERGDVHLLVTKEIIGKFIPVALGITPENKKKQPYDTIRDFSKTLSYGIAYGVTGKELSNQAMSKLGALNVQYTAEHGDESIKLWYDLFPVAGQWLKDSQNMVFDGYTDSVLGRKRFFDLSKVMESKWTKLAAMRAGCNQRVQSTCADMMKLAMVYVDRLLDRNKAWIILTVHDELILESREDYAIEAARILKFGMEHATKKFLSRLAHTVVVNPFISKRYDK